MEKRHFSVVFFCKKTTVNRKGKAPIYARVATNGANCQIHFNCSIEPEKWNQKTERISTRDPLSLKINEIIQTTRTKIFDIWDQLLCYLREYTEAKYSAEDIKLTRVDYAYIDGFVTFLQTAHRCQNNGAMEVLRVMKIFIRFCERNEWIDKNPFKFYKMRIDKKEIVHLTVPELEAVANKSLPIERLDKVRDIFVFCCYSGLAFTDVEHLRKENLVMDDDGKPWIYKPRQKTSVMSKIPLLPRAMNILKKWENDEQMRSTDRLLPVPSNQRMNAYLKEIAILCGINKNLTTHCARRTLASNSMELGMPIDITARILGHSSTDMTRKYYIKISDQKIRSEMEKLGERMKS